MTPFMPRNLGSRIWRARWPVYFEVAFIALVDLVYEVMRALVAPTHQGITTSVDHAHDIAQIEATFGGNVETSVQRVTDGIAGGRFATTWYYTLAYTALFVGFLAAVWLWRRPNYAFIRNWFIMSQAIALVAFWLYPSAPPRLATSGLVDTTRHALTLGGALGWFQHLRNQYAAMPSLHIGLSFLYALALVWLCAPWGRWRQIWWFLPVWMAWVTVATANHYLLDGIAGVLTVIVALALTHAFSAQDVPRPWQRSATDDA
jgi:hypothetical protein